MPPMVPGQWYNWSIAGSGGGSGSSISGRLYMVPFYVPYSTNFDRIGVVSSGAATGNVELAVYGPWTAAVAGLPRLVTTGVFAITGIGNYERVISLTLAPGWYLVGNLSNFAFNTQLYQTGTYIGGIGGSQVSGTAQSLAWIWDSQVHPMPATLPSNPSPQVSSVPSVRLRAA